MMNNNRWYMTAVSTFSLLFLAGCWPFTHDNTVEKNRAPQLFVINVLDQGDYDDCHITGSIHVDFDDFESAMKSWNKDDYYVVYCADYMCMSSGFCAKVLKDAGFKHVWAYEGGMAEWYQKGYPYQGLAEMDYLKSENINLAEGEESQVSIISAEELVAKIQEFGVGK